MSKSLKKLIDINRLREFKNKLVGTDSAYVQTGAVDQTVAGTKTFSKPIVGSVTGSSGSCTGNAASATKLQTARTINGTSFNGTANITTANWGTARNITITDGTNTSTAVSVNGSANVSLNLPSTIKATFVGNVTGNVTGNATSATKLQTVRSLWGNNFDGSQNLSGNIHFANDDLTGVVVGAIGKVGGNDFWRVGGGATANDSGFMELATADNGNEPIYVRQYTGEYATITRTATLLDASGNTQFPGTVTATAFYGNITGNVTGNCSGSSGSCTGNAATATKLQTARTINGTAFNGTANITTANWGTARNISITDGTNTSTAVSVNGSQAYSLNLPSTIKATFVGNVTGNVTGNCSGSSGSCTGNAATATRANSAANADHATNADSATYASRSANNGGFYISNYYVTIE